MFGEEPTAAAAKADAQHRRLVFALFPCSHFFSHKNHICTDSLSSGTETDATCTFGEFWKVIGHKGDFLILQTVQQGTERHKVVERNVSSFKEADLDSYFHLEVTSALNVKSSQPLLEWRRSTVDSLQCSLAELRWLVTRMRGDSIDVADWDRKKLRRALEQSEECNVAKIVSASNVGKKPPLKRPKSGREGVLLHATTAFFGKLALIR